MDELGIDDFERTTFRHDGKERAVYRRGRGPAVIVMAEMPGITPNVLRFAGWAADLGCTAVLPHLFGVPGRHPGRNTLSAGAYVNASFLPFCVRREFLVWATNRTSPVVRWLRALAVHEHERCGGPGVGAVGMCFTGGYALAMATDPRVLAPVLAQPSMPVPVTRAQRGGIDCSPDDLAVVRQRCERDGLEVLGLRFVGDRSVPAARFEHLRRELGDGFVAVELADDAANPAAVMRNPHSVLTEHLVDEPGSPTRAAVDQVLALLERALLGPAEG